MILDIEKQEELIYANKLLEKLGSLGEYILVDWGWLFVGNLENGYLINKYLMERLLVFSSNKQ